MMSWRYRSTTRRHGPSNESLARQTATPQSTPAKQRSKPPMTLAQFAREQAALIEVTMGLLPTIHPAMPAWQAARIRARIQRKRDKLAWWLAEADRLDAEAAASAAQARAGEGE